MKEEIGQNWSKIQNTVSNMRRVFVEWALPASDGFELFDAVRRVEVGDGHTAPYERRGDAAGQTGLGLGLG